jgi:hypothetical protein
MGVLRVCSLHDSLARNLTALHEDVLDAGGKTSSQYFEWKTIEQGSAT